MNPPTFACKSWTVLSQHREVASVHDQKAEERASSMLRRSHCKGDPRSAHVPSCMVSFITTGKAEGIDTSSPPSAHALRIFQNTQQAKGESESVKTTPACRMHSDDIMTMRM